MINPAELAERAAASDGVRAGLAKASLAELLAAAGHVSDRFFSSTEPQSEKSTIAVWLIHEELTARGVAPRFRGVTHLRSATFKRGVAWVDSTPAPVRNALLMARAIDLHWIVSNTTGGANTVRRRLKSEGVAGPTASSIIRSNESKPRIVDRIGVTQAEQLALLTLIGTDARSLRHKADKKASQYATLIEESKADRYRLPPEDVQVRKQWAESIALAHAAKTEPTGLDVVDWMRMRTGRTYTRQAANKFRRLLSDMQSVNELCAVSRDLKSLRSTGIDARMA